MRAIVVGAGGTTRDLLRGLGDVWEVVVIDSDPERLARAGKVRDISTYVGDGSSRVVMDRAGLADADAVVAATNDDAVNLEACRMAREAGIYHVVAVAADPERLPDYRALDVPAFSPDRLTAHRLQHRLEPLRVTSVPFADGRAEATEFRIAADSPVRGRSLVELQAQRFLVAALVRDGTVTVPHGDTILEEGDRVTVVGAAADYPLILRSFVAGGARFPIAHGRQVAVALDSERDLTGPVAEAVALTRNSSAETVLVVHRNLETLKDDARIAELQTLLARLGETAEGIEIRYRPVEEPPHRDLAAAVAGESVGVMVVRAPAGGTLRGRLAAVKLVGSVQEGRIPVLISRGATSYERIVVAIRRTTRGRTASRAALDLAAYNASTLVAVGIAAPLASREARANVVREVAAVGEEASLLGVSLKRRVRQGTTSRVLEHIEEGDLVVLPMPRQRPTVFRPGTATQVIRAAPSSVLLVPQPR